MTIQVREKVEPEVLVKTGADALRNAARILEERGWIQDHTTDAAGGLCVLGAVAMATRGHLLAVDVKLADYFDAYLGTSQVTWNDAPDRTAAEVTAALRAAADAYETGPVRP